VVLVGARRLYVWLPRLRRLGSVLGRGNPTLAWPQLAATFSSFVRWNGPQSFQVRQRVVGQSPLNVSVIFIVGMDQIDSSIHVLVLAFDQE